MFLGLFRKKVKIVKRKVKKSVKPKLKKPKIKKTKVTKRAASVVKPESKRRKAKIPQIVGKVTHYFPHVKAGVILVTNGTIALGDTLQIKGHTTDFKQKISSMQINNAPIKEAKPKDEVGLLVKSRVRHNDVVYKL